MQVTETRSEGLKREYRIVVPADEIEDEIKEKLDQLRSTVQIKGFRPGKVPLSLLRRRYGDTVLSEVIKEAVTRTSQQAVLDRGVRPALPPEIEVDKVETGSDLEYTMSLEALPEIEPGDIKGLELTRLKAEVTEETVEKALERMAAEQRSFVAIEAERAAEKGDGVRIDFAGTIDGEAFEGGSGTDLNLELGSGGFLPGFEDQLVGVKAGDHLEVKVAFPEDYPGKHVAGKEAVFEVDVKEVLEREAVAVNDELAKRLGLDDLTSLRAALRERIERDYRRTARLRLKRELLDKLAESHHFEVPPGMAEREFDSIWRQIEQDMEKSGTGWDEAEQSEEETRADYRRIAERRVRLGLLLSEIGQRNNIVVPQEELNRAVMDQARRFPGQEQQVFDHFRDNPQAMNELQAPIYEEKVVDFIIEMAEVTDQAVSPEELFSDPDDGAGAPGESTEAPVPPGG
jgi:trigger factor